MKQLNTLTQEIIGSAIEVHREKGPGLLESSYEACLAHELILRGHVCHRQISVPLVYKGTAIDVAFRADLIVDDKVLSNLRPSNTSFPCIVPRSFRISEKRATPSVC